MRLTPPSSTQKGLLQTDQLYEYILKTSVYPREPELLKEIRDLSSTHPRSFMVTSPDAGQFMALILKLINAKKTIEIGIFTGYSLLLTALAIPDDGKITAIDIDRSTYDMIGLPVIKKAGLTHKINFIESAALPVLEQLLQDPENHESFDFAFVDADKNNYANYHEKLLKLLKPGGIIMYDNTLWGGTVVMAAEFVPPAWSEMRVHVIEFNRNLAADSRVEISQLPLGDGLTMCRRL
ncbi:O-methyltransferase [Handroanthus impetiginosus]|uniref:O-methyltransferase n=1 Tax=Handroanthus impetiginosus TaxID=429701 RepID=A0A2G9HLY5_9LAMI|nr:O-methyltransferase [Handroanthus impetiginosus]